MGQNLIRPIIDIPSGRQNEPVRLPNAPLVATPLAQTFLTADTASGVSTLTVKNIGGFAINQILLIGTFGNQGSEIIKTHPSTAPSGSTITLGQNTVFPHSSSTPIYSIPYDQFEISQAVGTGPKSTVTTASIAGQLFETIYNDNVATTTGALYFARYKNSIGATFSPYSDSVPITGYTNLSARRIIDNALAAINKKTSEILTDEFAFNEINNCQIEVLRELKRWSWMQSFHSSLGSSTTGGWLVAIPTDLDDQNTKRSIYNLTFGNQGDLTWVDKESWDRITQGVSQTTLASNIIVGATTITLTNSADFDNAGTVTIGPNSYVYTANNKNTGVLTLDTTSYPTGSTTVNTAGQYVFEGATLGLPQYYTIYGGNIYHYPVVASTYGGLTYYLDYYKSITQITQDNDTIVIPDPTVVQYYLEWKFLKKANNGVDDAASQSSYTNYILRREKLKAKETLGTSYVMRPRFNDWARQMRGLDDDDKQTRLGNFPNA